MKIAYLDGRRLYRVLYAGIQNILDNQDYLNKINVFPVPDGDTGTNMAYTLMGIAERMQTHLYLPLGELSQEVA
ncbi:MAG TPA: dihydroxyacetone kinase, partial [Candidatus Marinimicrobia bacterium]|nr:dihydroxyacetone kinase [Candidatus Neomarinimicrobiota bacterium]